MRKKYKKIIYPLLVSSFVFCSPGVIRSMDSSRGLESLAYYAKIRETAESDLDEERLNALYEDLTENKYAHDKNVNYHILKTISLLKNSGNYQGREQEIFDCVGYSGELQDLKNLFIRQIENIDGLNFLQSLIPTELVSQEEWEKINKVANSMFELDAIENSKRPSFDDPIEYLVDTLKEHSQMAIMKIGQHLQPGDTLVAVGNTPQYLIEIMKLDFINKPYNLLSAAISGHPGRVKYPNFWIQDVITPLGLENYRKYLHEIGYFNPDHHQGVIWFLDIMNTAGGTRFLIDELKHFFQEQDKKPPEIKLMALNKPSSSSLRSFPEAIISLDLELASVLDQCPDDMRILPSLPAYKWHILALENFPKPGEVHTKKAQQTLDILKEIIPICNQLSP